MLAGKADTTSLRFPVMCSPKLDGVRCVVINGIALSRSLKPIPNRYIQRILSKGYENLDGELIVGDITAKDAYRTTVSAVMSEDGEPKFVFAVFDITVLGNHPFYERFELVDKAVENTSKCIIVPHVTINNLQELNAFEADCLEKGYEGVMIRDPNGQYKHGRSSTKEGILLKLKRFSDSEAEILGVEELMHNANDATTNELGRTKRSSHKENMEPMGTLGALKVKDIKSGVEFNIGTGFDQETRQKLWDRRKKIIGKIVKYKYFEIGVKDAPRFPVFLGLRDKRDM